MKRHGMIMLAVGAFAAAPAIASDKADFEQCDGLVHPGKEADGMRGAASSRPYVGLFGAAGLGGGTAEACTRALASPRLLPTQTVRRAHLLRARAASALQAGDTAAATKDLDLAEAALGPAAAEPFMKRSMGVSLTLLRAIARAQGGDAAGAVPLARTAAAARPYSLQVQQVAAEIVQAARPAGDTSATPWARVIPLEPEAAGTALIREAEVGNFAGVIALRPSVTVIWPTEAIAPFAFAARGPATQQLLSAMIVSLHTAYARAATGDTAGARRDLADVRAHVANVNTDTGTLKQPMAPALVAEGKKLTDALGKFVDSRARQIDARIAIDEQRPSDAIAALVAAPMPSDAATVDLLRALKAAVPAKDAGMVPALTTFERDSATERSAALKGAITTAMIAPETPRAVLDYARARPNILGALIGGALTMGTSLLGGIDRTDGFRSTNNPDGTIKVEFIGNTPSATLVQEMTLLRAAEVARAAGKPAFVITNRNEFSRRMVRSQYGREISSTPTGYKSELTIRPVAAGTEPQRALDAVAIIDALGPLYYEDKQAT